MELPAHAEAAADIALEHVDAVLRKIHVLGERAPRGERHLGGARHGELGLGAVPVGEQPARLHADGAMALH
jgi:hypothetical protein